MTSASRGNAPGGHLVNGAQIQPGVIAYSHLAAAAQETMAGFRDKLINGDFRIWQRGTSLAAGMGRRFIADRWADECNGSTIAPSQQAFAPGQTTVPGEPQFFHRSVVASSAGAGNYAAFTQRIEGVRSLAGQTVTVSFYAKADAVKNIAVEFQQNFGTGGSPSANVNTIGTTTKLLGTTFQKFTVTAAIPSIAGKTLGSNGNDWVELIFWLDAGSTFSARTNSLGQQSGTFDIACVKLEAGGDATPYAPRPLGLEDLLCKRYFERMYGIEYGTGGVNSSNSAWVPLRAWQVKKRATPTVTPTAASTFYMWSSTAGNTTCTAITVQSPGADSVLLSVSTSGSPALTPGQACLLQDNGNSYIDVDAEL